MFTLLTDSNCSPEEFGDIIGVSGMTIRRWEKKSKIEEIPKLYLPAIRDACYRLVSEGRLSESSHMVRAILLNSSTYQFVAAIRSLGLPKDFSQREPSLDNLILGLSHIGAYDVKQNEVSINKKKIFSYKALGKEWSSHISRLWRVITSSKLANIDKLVAYGALFYLLTPIDFIPDQIPFFGLLDDLAVLGSAVNFYSMRFSSFV